MLFLRQDLGEAFSREIAVVRLTYSLRFFNLVIGARTVTVEKMLMVDNAAIMETYENREMSMNGWIRSGGNLTEAFTETSICLHWARL